MTPGLLRRFAAMFYDTLLVVAILMVASIPVVIFAGDAEIGGNVFYRLYLLAIITAFYTGFWTHGGQTLGMKTWRLRVVKTDGTPISRRDGLVRFAAALLSWLPAGLGYFWIVFDKERLAWHDRLSKTRLVLLPKASAS